VTGLVTALGAVGRGAPRGELEVRRLPADEPDEAHLERVREALRLIAAGDLYEVNLARRIRLHVRGDRLTLLALLLDAAPAPWGFLQELGDNVVCGASPELALSVRGDTLRTCPVKGTRPRGADAQTDARLALALDSDPKERAELTMAVDVHRNDLGRVAVPGSVRVLGEPRVLPGRTVWSRVAEVVARRAPGATLEPWRRGAYTGAFGWVGRDGRLELAMAIRTVQGGRGGGDEGHEAEYFTGGGIVADSVPERELEETRWKAAQLESLSHAGQPVSR
jgi:anthranilate/para-aminobenzoate synthase component I